ncbi:hypothetical protein FKM82_019728 [Ascaphus truei]
MVKHILHTANHISNMLNTHYAQQVQGAVCIQCICLQKCKFRCKMHQKSLECKESYQIQELVKPDLLHNSDVSLLKDIVLSTNAQRWKSQNVDTAFGSTSVKVYVNGSTRISNNKTVFIKMGASKKLCGTKYQAPVEVDSV